MSSSLQNSLSDQIKEAYEVWQKKRPEIYADIDQHLEKLAQEDTHMAKELMKPVPAEIWEVEECEKKKAIAWPTEVNKLFPRERTAFGVDISGLHEYDTEKVHLFIHEVAKADLKYIEEGSQGPFRSVKSCLADLLKRFVTCCVVDLTKKFIIKISNKILDIVRKIDPMPSFKTLDGLQDGKSAMRYLEQEFKNWGNTVEKEPSYTFFPKTVEGVCNIVKYAKEKGKGIRMSGFRHSWPDHWADNDQIQVAMLPVAITDKLNYMIDLVKSGNPDIPFNVVYFHGDWDDSEFVHIDEPQPEFTGKDGKRYAHVRVGAAVCGLQILEWCFYRYKNGLKGYQLPLDVIMSFNTYGGTLNTSSHGAGWKHPTLSDLVVKIEYVDANGNHHAIDDPRLLQAAAGSVGMLGIITHITFKMEATSFALFQPRDVELQKAIPPVKDTSSENYRQMLSDIVNSSYCEWFLFYGCKHVYKNVWEDNGKVEDYTGPFINLVEQEFERGSSYLMGIIQAVLLAMDKFRFFDVFKYTLQFFMPKLAMMAMAKPKKPATALTFDVLHYRRGINYLPVRCMEFLIPIPESQEAKGEPDFTILQKAWWDAQNLLKEYSKNDSKERPPADLTLESRVISGSNIFLAPEYNNPYGTVSIEILGTMLPEQADWDDFKNRIAKIWTSYTDHNGKPLNVRPHWGKEFPSKFGDEDCYVYVRRAHADSFKKFKATIKRIAKMHGFTIDDMRRRFSNAWLEGIFGPLWDAQD